MELKKNFRFAIDSTPDNCNTTSATMTNFLQSELAREENSRRGFIGFYSLIQHPVAALSIRSGLERKESFRQAAVSAH